MRKSSIWKLVALAAVVSLGFFAVVQTQRGLQDDSPVEEDAVGAQSDTNESDGEDRRSPDAFTSGLVVSSQTEPSTAKAPLNNPFIDSKDLPPIPSRTDQKSITAVSHSGSAKTTSGKTPVPVFNLGKQRSSSPSKSSVPPIPSIGDPKTAATKNPFGRSDDPVKDGFQSKPTKTDSNPFKTAKTTTKKSGGDSPQSLFGAVAEPETTPSSGGNSDKQDDGPKTVFGARIEPPTKTAPIDGGSPFSADNKTVKTEPPAAGGPVFGTRKAPAKSTSNPEEQSTKAAPQTNPFGPSATSKPKIEPRQPATTKTAFPPTNSGNSAAKQEPFGTSGTPFGKSQSEKTEPSKTLPSLTEPGRKAPLQTENPFKSTSDNRTPTNSAAQFDKGTQKTGSGEAPKPLFGSELNEPVTGIPKTSRGDGTFPAKSATKTQAGNSAKNDPPVPPSRLAPVQTASPMEKSSPNATQRPTRDLVKGSVNKAPQQAARVTISKTAPRSAVLGKPFIYDIEIRNVGGSAAQNVVVNDPIPRGVRLEGSDPQAYQSGNKLVWKLGTLQAGKSRKISVKVTPLHAGQIGSVATVNFVAKTAGIAKPAVPKLMFRMQGPEKAGMGEKVTFRFKISNVGNTDAIDVWLRDIIPDGLKHPGGDDLEYRIGKLAVGTSRNISLSMTVVKPGRLTNRAFVTATGGVRLEAKSIVNITASKLVIARTGPKRRVLGRVALFQNMVTNGSTETVPDATLVEAVPAGMDFVAASGGGVFDPTKRVVAWKLGTLTPGQSKTVQLKLLPRKSGVQHSIVKAVGNDGTAVQTASATRVDGYAALGIDIPEVDGPVNVGRQITLRVIARNRGTAVSSNVRLTVTLPKQLSLVSVRGPGTYKVDGQTVTFDTVNSLAGKKRVVYDLTLKAIATGDSRVKVQIQSDEMSKPLNREEAVLVLPFSR